MAGKERWLLEQADGWRKEGLIDPAVHQELRRRYAAGAQEEVGFLRIVLASFGGIIGFLAVFFLFREFWPFLTDGEKFMILAACSVVAYVAAGFLEWFDRWSLVSGVGFALGGGLALFAFTYVTEDPQRVVPVEAFALMAAFALSLASLVYGYVRRAPAAGVGTVMLSLSFLLVPQFAQLSQDGDKAIVSTWLAVGLVHALANLALWRGTGWIRVGRPLPPFSVPIAGTINAIILVPATIAFVGVVLEPQTSWTGIVGLAVLGGALMTAGILTRFPGLIVVGGLALIGAALWAGFDQGDVVGTIVALAVVAGLLIWLAQSGTIARWLKAAQREDERPPQHGHG